MTMELRPYQAEGLNEIRSLYANGTKKVLLHLTMGGGKCLGRGTPVLMFDGTIKKVEDVIVGDLLMGPDSRPRTVASLARGQEMMYRVKPIKGDEWRCNESHILSLVHTETGKIENISVSEFLAKNKTFRDVHKLYRVGVDFPSTPTEHEPYLIGLYAAEGSHHSPMITNPDEEILSYLRDWADREGDIIRGRQGRGCVEYHFRSQSRGWFATKMRHIKNAVCHAGTTDRRIPREYLVNSREVRLQVLAGLIDGDGHLHHNGFEVVTKYPTLKDDILFLARSLGLRATHRVKIGRIKELGFRGEYFRIVISGDTDMIPTKVPRKQALPRLQKKNVLRTGFSLIEDGVDDYYGFTLDGDRLFLLGDFTVAHNTLCFCTILKNAYEKRRRAFVVVAGVHLVEQASFRLDREGVPHGVIQGNHWRNLPDEPIQVCSITTLRRRNNVPKADLIIIDECHQAGSDSYHWLVSQYPDAYFLGVSATPHVKGGLRHIADAVVYPISVKELMEQGYLSKPRYFIPSRPDLKGVRITGDDYNQAALADAMMKQANIYGDIIKAYKTIGQMKPALMFAVNIDHSKSLVEKFNAAGIEAVHLDANASIVERNNAIEQLRTGDIKVISNVGIMTTGVDIPFVEVLILARPTQSYNLHCQILGRGTRISPETGKEKFIVLDHAGNIDRHGPIEDERPVDLDGWQKEKTRALLMKQCEQCFFAWQPMGPGEACPSCSWKKEGDSTEREIEQDETVELVELDQSRQASLREQEIESLFRLAKSKGFKPRWVYYKMKEKYGQQYTDRVYSAYEKRLA